MRTNITVKLRVNLVPSIDGAPPPDRDAAPRRSLTPPSVHGYHSGMRFLRVPMLVLAVAQAALAGLTAMVGAFADGGDIWSRLVVVLLHPLCAVSLLLLVLSPRLTRVRMLAIGRGAVKGDWELPVVFSVIPALGVVYALILARAPNRSSPA